MDLWNKKKHGHAAAALALVLAFGGLSGPVASAFAAVRHSASAMGAPAASRQPALRTLLLAGIDRDPQSAVRDRRTDDHTDALILLASRPGSGVVQALHIPRDTLVWTSAGAQKINGVLRVGGPQALAHAVTALTRLPVDAMVTIDFARFRNVMQAFGRFPFYVDRPIASPERDAYLGAGPRALTPREALAVVRFRHEALGDIGRVHRQERFMRSAITRAARLPYQAFAALMRVADPQIDTPVIRTAYALIHPLRAYVAHSIPGSFSTGPGASYWLPDQTGIEALARVISGDKSAPAALAAWSRRLGGADVDDGRDRSL